MVAMSVWPTDGADGSVASEARWRKMGRLWSPSGVVAGVGGELKPTLAMPNLTVQSGAAWVDGHYTELATNQVLTATANGLAIVRFDPAANSAELLWRDGVSTPTQNPTGTWELPIAKTVGSVLTDLRGISVVGSAQSSTTIGPPTLGTWTRGNLWLDSANTQWICVTGGTPGTWSRESPFGVVKGAATTDAAGKAGLANPRPVVPLIVLGQLVGQTNQSGNALVTAAASTTDFLVVQLFDSRGTGFLANQPVQLELLVVYPGS
ncbi:MAG TPA: hypothetical protein VJM75_13850 [Acidimicrobiales bacterium]|nr:hypothetical protein [Acidimicrobiales bacterium]